MVRETPFRGQRREAFSFVGVLGGMGPAATARFYRVLIELTPADRDQDHVPVVVWGDPRIPDRSTAIVSGGESPLRQLITAAERMVALGAAMIVMPCNTAHAYLEELRAVAAPIPFLDMIGETVAVVSQRVPSGASTTVFATRGALKAGLYQTAMDKAHLQLALPNEEQQTRIDTAIAQVKAGREHVQRAGAALAELGRELEKSGVAGVIGGCTEVAIALESVEFPLTFVDSGRSLAEAVIVRFNEVGAQPSSASARASIARTSGSHVSSLERSALSPPSSTTARISEA
jgi:aspartate racemase